jgi:hypothetical protein|tara:strand:+ start:1237 stop:1995 length:759 start_codon:yes stop_codon:yes gene_type:complete
MSNETNKNHIMICTPVHSDVSIHYMKACLDLQKECILNKIKITFQLMKSSLVTQGRNLCASAFMNSDAEYMLFIDSDVEFTTRSVMRLMKSPHDVSLIPYPIKQKTDAKFRKDFETRPDDDINTMGHLFPIEIPNTKDIRPVDGYIEVIKGPTGMMMIKKSVFEKLKEHYKELVIKQKTLMNGELIDRPNYYNFFDTYWSPSKKTYMGEDFYFCQLWRAIGGKIFALCDEEISHIGEYKYTGKVKDEFYKIG